MNDLRQAAQLALEALDSDNPDIQLRAATALRAALAQPEPEPVAWECKAGGLRPLTQKHYDAQPDNIKRHYTRIAPPQRKPLTEEEIREVGRTYSTEVWADDGWSIDFARAVEAAHGIIESGIQGDKA